MVIFETKKEITNSEGELLAVCPEFNIIFHDEMDEETESYKWNSSVDSEGNIVVTPDIKIYRALVQDSEGNYIPGSTTTIEKDGTAI